MENLREDNSKFEKCFIQDIHEKGKFGIKGKSIKAIECEGAKL